MKRRSLGLLPLLLSLLAPVAAAAEPEAAQQRLLESLQYLASDERQGRGVGTEGLEQAGEFIAKHFADLGLRSDWIDGQPFQYFEVPLAGKLGPEEENRLAIQIGDGEPAQRQQLKINKQFQPMLAGATGQVEDAPLVFVGYGITAPMLQYDDYADVEAEGKVVLMLRREPRQADAESPFNGEQPSRHAYFRTKIQNARRHGAAAMIVVNDEHTAVQSRANDHKKLDEQAGKLAELVLKEKLEEGEAEVKKSLAQSIVAIQQRIKSDSYDQLPGIAGMGPSTGSGSMPVFFCARKAIDDLLQKAGADSLSDLEAAIDSDLKPRSTELQNSLVSCQASIVRETARVRNVLASLEGSGPHAEETIVVGAHYDHLGNGGPGSLAPWTRDVHNGADDNASGTAVLMEVARQLASREKPPARRILFVAFSGEERGLLGSRHYARNPVLPLDKTVAMFNLDMVGRLTDNKLQVHGVGTAREFEPLVDELNEKYGFQLAKRPGGNGPSDHATFYAQKVPVLHLFTDLHSDYHRPSDDVEKLNLEGMRRISQLLVEIIDRTAAADSRPQFVEIRGRRRHR